MYYDVQMFIKADATLWKRSTLTLQTNFSLVRWRIHLRHCYMWGIEKSWGLVFVLGREWGAKNSHSMESMRLNENIQLDDLPGRSSVYTHTHTHAHTHTHTHTRIHTHTLTKSLQGLVSCCHGPHWSLVAMGILFGWCSHFCLVAYLFVWSFTASPYAMS